MTKYQLECTCGKVTEVEAENREEAVKLMEAIMTPEAVATHFAQTDKHKGETAPTPEQTKEMINQHLKEVSIEENAVHSESPQA